MHENHNLFLFLIEINNMHRTRHILPIPRTCIWRWCGQCGRCSVSWHRPGYCSIESSIAGHRCVSTGKINDFN